MSPIDDELRAALRGRADVLTPAPDPLAGIERRARGIRRRRVVASVAGSALAVAAIALAVPALMPSALPDQVPPPIATVGPSPAPSPAPTPVPSPASTALALDPAAPWPYRGDPEVKAQGDLDAYVVEFAAKRGVLTDDVRLSPLFGQVYEPSGTPELVYVATVTSSGDSWWGVARASESGPELLVDVPLGDNTTALLAALPGDEVARLLVIAAPEVELIDYQERASAAPAGLAVLADGVAVGPLRPGLTTDVVRVFTKEGGVVFEGPAPDPGGTEPVPVAGTPDNLLGWPFRGQADGPLEKRAGEAFAKQKGVALTDVTLQVLFTGGNETGQKYTVLQGYAPGKRAQVFGWIESPGFDPELQLRPETEVGTPVVAILLDTIPFPLGTPVADYVNRLVLVVEPGTTRVLYRAREGEQASPATGPSEGVFVVDREMYKLNVPFTDSITVLDAAGRQTLDAPVNSLICGLNYCDGVPRRR